MPLISVIVPVYKVENVIHNCIESILNQTFADFELLLINDGSPDKSGEICDKYAEKDTRIRVIHKENEGVSVARNTGFSLAQGKYIVCVDSDDYVDEDYLQSFLDAKEKYPEAEIIWCGMKTVKDYNKTVMDYIRFSDTEAVSITKVNKIMTLHQKWLDTASCNKLFSTQLIQENNLFMDKSLSLGEDLLFVFAYLDACKNKNVYINNKCTYSYVRRTDAESLDNKYRADIFDIYKHINKTMSDYIAKWQVDEHQMQMFNNSVYCSYDKCLRNSFIKGSPLSKKECYKVNNKILQSKEFAQSVKNAKGIIVLPLRMAYATKNYYVVEKVSDIIATISKLKRKFIK